MSEDEKELELFLTESLDVLQISKQNQHGEDSKEKAEHILHDVAEWRNKKEAKEKAEAIEKIKQFKVKITTFEKERSSQVFNKKHEFRKEFSELEEFEMKLSTERTNEKSTVQSYIQKISANVKQFQNEIQGPRTTPQFLEKLKMLMEDIESSILKYKQQQGALYEQMMKEEKQISADLDSFEKKMQSWTTSAPSAKGTQSKIKQSENSKVVSVPPEVKAFEKFLLQTGGHQGGWDEYDHQTFLKLRKKFKFFEEFLANAEAEIPTRSRDDIVQHNEWYKEYVILRENKRTAIAKWKDMKESEKQDKLHRVEEDVELEKRREQKQREIIEKEKIDRFSKLEKWKLDKELRRQEVLDKEKEKHETERRQKEEEEQRRKEEARLKVQEYQRRKREDEKILEMARKAREEEMMLANKLTEAEKYRIKERDRKLLEEKRRRIDSKEREKIEKEKRLDKLRSQVEVRVERDPSRLYKMTEGWKERKKAAKAENSQPQANFQRRAVPSWRQGMH